tara:strand:+ start:1465 stop:2076 length:612 start_codon:yes stop_codon:yes gene_type:complete
MSVRLKPAALLTDRQRLVLLNGSTLAAREDKLIVPEADLTFEKLVSIGVKALNITAAGIRPLQLKKIGFDTPLHLKRVGFDALHFVDPVFCAEANAAYGSTAILETFLAYPSDAVALAGSEAVELLGIRTEDLLQVCAGAPTEAAAVLQQTTSAAPLRGVAAATLLDTGLRGAPLRELGVTILSLKDLSHPPPDLLQKLNFKL